MPRKKSKYKCAHCLNWQPGDSWQMNAAGVYADGTCKKTGRAVANVHRACMCFDKDPYRGVMIRLDMKEFYKDINRQKEAEE